MSSVKSEIAINSGSEFEVESPGLHFRAQQRAIDLAESIRIGLTVLALAAGITVLGVSADSLSVYNSTNLPADFHLQLWPARFNLAPTTALVAGSAIVTVANAVSLVASKTRSHPAISLAAPIVAFISSLVAICLFYAANASTTEDTLLSWTCRWKAVPMAAEPHFGTLCRQSQAGVVLSVLLVPIEAFIMVVAGRQAVLQRRVYGSSPRM